MISLTTAQQEIVKSDSTVKNFRVHFPNGELSDLTNDSIVFESVRFTESVCSEETFRFGCAEASVIEFETVGVQNIIGMVIECSMEFISEDDVTVSIPYGTFIVDSCPRDHQNMTHRKITGYSLIKYMFDLDGFLQKQVLHLESVHVSLDAIRAYVTGDTTGFTEVTPTSTDRQMDQLFLFDSAGLPYNFVLYEAVDEPAFYGTYISARAAGYKLDFEESGSVSNDDVGMQIVEYLDNNGYDLTYDANLRKVFETNEDALRSICGYLFEPTIYPEANLTGGNVYYRSFPAITNRFVPKPTDLSIRRYAIYALADISHVMLRRASTRNIYGSGVTWTSIETIPISGYSADVQVTEYSGTASKLNTIEIKSTLAVEGFIFQAKSSNRVKSFYGNAYSYSNAYSNRDLMDGWAELNGAFIHSERDGSISIETLDNSDPYPITAADVDGSAWWDEYNVNPVGVVLYTFQNPLTDQIESGAYRIGDGPSVYDLSGNKVLEAMTFTVKKTSAFTADSDVNSFYIYTGSQLGYTNGDIYYYDGEFWRSGGHYTDITSAVGCVIRNLFASHVGTVNFTPVEMTIRALPYLEAGDAFTFTAEDGTVISSYLLAHNMSGIQYIAEQITSVAGEII